MKVVLLSKHQPFTIFYVLFSQIVQRQQPLSGKKVRNNMPGFLTSSLKVIVYDDFVKMMAEGNFICGFIEPVLQCFCRFGGAKLQPSFQFLNRGGVYKNGQALIRILFLYMNSTLQVDIQD